MRFLHLWPLIFLVFLPAVILLYLLKQKAEEKQVSSLYLWEEVYKNLQASVPWEKLKNNFLMYLHLLFLLLLIAAMTSPYLTKGGTDCKRFLFVLDNSGSMNSIYADGKSRLRTAKDLAEEYADKLPEDAKVTVLAGAGEGTLLLNSSSDKGEIKRVIENIEETDVKGDLSGAVSLAEASTAGWEDYQAVFFTDASLDAGSIQGELVNLNSTGVNGAIDSVSHKREADGSLTVLVRVSNTGNEVLCTELNLYLDDTLFGVETVGEKEGLLAGESRLFYFRNIQANPSVIRAELNEADSLLADNTAYDVISGEGRKKVLLVSEQNIFLEKAMAVLPDIEIYKTPDTSGIGEEAFDLYIFDGVVPEELPKNGNLLFFNPPSGIDGLFEVNGVTEGAWVTAKENEVTAYTKDYTFGVNEIVVIDKPEFAESFLSYSVPTKTDSTSDGNGEMTGSGNDIVTKSAGFIGKTKGRTVGVVAFDIHSSDLPLQAEFPMLMYGLVNACVESELTNAAVIEAGSSIEIYSQDAEKDIFVGEERLEGGRAVTYYNNTNVTGIYKVKQGEKESVFAVNFPMQESQTFGVDVVYSGEALVQGGVGENTETIGMNLRNPLIILCLVLLLAEWLLTVKQGLLPKSDRHRRRLIMALQGSVFVLLLLAVWNPSLTMGGRSVTTIFLVDVSDSVSGQKKEAEVFIKEALKEMSASDKAGIVAFGADSKVEQFVSEKNLFTGLETVPLTTATNLENAVQGAMALFPEKEGKRLVLLTDGNENEGSLKRMTQSVVNADVQIQVKELKTQLGEEVLVESLSVPDKIKLGDTFLVEVTIKSNVKTSAVLSLYAGNALKSQKEVELETGSNRFVFQDVQEQGGLKSYRVIVEADRDSEGLNNEYVAFTRAEEPEQVLLIAGKADNSYAMEQILQAANINYRLAAANAAPKTLLELNQYKSIILLNVHADDLPEGFMNNVESYVRDYAGGLVAIGGDNSFALGNYRGTALENVLPVYMDLQGEKEVPKMAVALVIDRSGSMAEGNGVFTQLELAKEAAVAALDTLRETDEIGVVAFESSYEWVVPLTVAADTESVEDAIASIGLGGGTSIYPAVNAACQELKKSDAKRKHIILLTDGQDGFDEYESLLDDLGKNGITLSSVAVGDGADTRLLEYLAEKGNGRSYYTDGNTDIPRIFAKEIFLSVNSYLINEEFTPIRTAQKDMLDTTADKGLPVMYGYIAATKKELATMHLMSEREDPILTSWQYGLGRTVAFNSDAENNWTANYAAWSEYPLFWKNIIEYTMTDTGSTDNQVSVKQNGLETEVTYTTEKYDENTVVEAIVTAEDGDRQQILLKASAPGVFEGKYKTSGTGVYSMSVTQKEGENVVSTENTAVAVQYSSEYGIVEENELLKEWVQETNGSFVEAADEVFRKEVQKVRSQRELAPYFLTLAVFVFFAAVVCKRFRIRRPDSMKKGRSQEEPIEDSLVKKEGLQEEPVENGQMKKTEEKPWKRRRKKETKRKDTPERLDTAALLKGKRKS